MKVCVVLTPPSVPLHLSPATPTRHSTAFMVASLVFGHHPVLLADEIDEVHFKTFKQIDQMLKFACHA